MPRGTEHGQTDGYRVSDPLVHQVHSSRAQGGIHDIEESPLLHRRYLGRDRQADAGALLGKCRKLLQRVGQDQFHIGRIGDYPVDHGADDPDVHRIFLIHLIGFIPDRKDFAAPHGDHIPDLHELFPAAVAKLQSVGAEIDPDHICKKHPYTSSRPG